MDINRFAKRVSELEAGRKQVNIGQIKEILRCVNRLTKGLLYAIIKYLL